jgi:glycosyltransferase involved in cell wall biosynthesis
MQIIQAVFGTFHHFELARELNSRGHLKKIYSTFPWKRLAREGVPREKVGMFPWLHTPLTLLGRYGCKPRWLEDELGYFNALAFDDWLAGRVLECDAFIAISGAGLKTGRLVQQRGGKFICDRGSTHTRYQDQVVSEEFRRWGVELQPNDERDNVREEAIYEQADAITVPSSFVRQTFIDMGIPGEKVKTIPYGVRLENFFPVALPPEDAFEVLFVGSVSLRKGVPYLLQAFAQIRHPRKRLRVVGALHDSVKVALSRLPLEQVELLGAVDQQRVRQLMSTSHVLVLPSIEEGLALVQGQALACGCPVIATPNAGAEDLFADGVEGFIVPVRSVDALTQRMQQLADDPLLQKEMSRAALARVQKIGGWAEYGRQWEDYLKKMLA